MNAVQAGEISVNNNTQYAIVRASSGSYALGLLIRRIAGAGTVAVTLQGGWDNTTTDADWVDTSTTVGAYNSNNPVRVGTKEDNVWPYYRIKVVSTGIATIAYRLVSLTH